MTLTELKLILKNRLGSLASARSHAVAIGDACRVAELDAEILETEATLGQLDTL